MLMLLMGALLSQSNLDAPVEDKPTVRSEIIRGFEAGEACADVMAAASTVDGCILRVRDRYRATRSNTAAFELGLNIQKWRIGARFVKVGRELSKSRLAQDYAVSGQLSAMTGRDEAEAGAARLGISIDDAIDAAGTLRPEF